MERRKVQTVGGGTYTVSLPKDWAERQGIDAGDTLDLHAHVDGVLVVQAGSAPATPPDRITVRVDHDGADAVAWTLRAAYAAGVTAVRFEGGLTTRQRRALEGAARDLTGVSVADDGDVGVTVKTTLDTDEMSVDQSVRQIAFVALSMHREATAGLSGGVDPAALTDRDDQADRLYAMLDRALGRGLARLEEVEALGQSRPAVFEMWATARELERVADHATGIATVVDEAVGEPDPEAVDRLREFAWTAREIVSDAVEAVLGERSVPLAERALERRDELVSALEEFEADRADATVRLISHRVRRTAEHGGNVAELALRRAVRTDDAGESFHDRPAGAPAEE